MAQLKEDVEEEQEFRSLSSFYQQRYMKIIQDMEDQFKEIRSELKQKCKEKEFQDIQALDPYKERFEDQIDYWNSKLVIWESKHNEKKRLSRRLQR